MQLKASAPGSIMLLGEYAVLYGKPALVSAIDKRIHVSLRPRADEAITIQAAAGHYQTQLNAIQIEQPYQFVLGVIKHLQPKIKKGFDLTIASDFSDQLGLGSSAAVTVACMASIIKWLDIRITPIDLIRQGTNVIQMVQGRGSGADIAASVMGGIVRYSNKPISVEKFNLTLPCTLIYSGYKTPTAKVLSQVQDEFAEMPLLFKSIINTIAACTQEGIHALRKQDLAKLGKLMNVHQSCHVALGVNTAEMAEIIAALNEDQEMLGVKISGSGMGDCVIGLGKALAKQDVKLGTILDVKMALQGVQCEKN